MQNIFEVNKVGFKSFEMIPPLTLSNPFSLKLYGTSYLLMCRMIAICCQAL